MSENRNPFLARQERTKNLTNSHRRSKKQEQSLAQQLKGMRTPASGAGAIKGDVRLKKVMRVECKTTQHKSFSVTLDMVQKIVEAGVGSGEIPAMEIEFNDGFGRRLMAVALVPTWVLNDIAEASNADTPTAPIRRRR